MPKAQLFDAMESSQSDAVIKIVDVYICKLRRKLGLGAIVTAWGTGYALSEVGWYKVRAALDIAERAAA
jgi:DNA-binding response OmpR family regulator